MVTSRWRASGAIVALLLVGAAGSAAAQLDGSNGCSASGAFRNGGFNVDARDIGNEVVVVPRSDTVDWQGSLTNPPGKYSGSIAVELPPPFGDVQIDSWQGNSQTSANSGSEEYDLPSWVPADVEFRVVGTHTDENGTCNGYVRMKIDGSPFSSPLAPISLAGTVLSGGGLFAVLRPAFRRVPRRPSTAPQGVTS